MSRPFRILIFCLLPLFASAADRLVVRGSDLIPEELIEHLRQQLHLHHPDLDLRINFDGSLLALKSVNAGETHLAVVALPPGRLELPIDLDAYPLFFQAPVVLVNRDNPIDEIPLARVQMIFAAGGQPPTRWGELGAEEQPWESRVIQPALLNRTDSTAMQMFRSTVLAGANLRGGVARLSDRSELEELVRSNPAMIAVTDRLPSNPETLKPLALAAIGESIAFSPSAENIHFGDYPVIMPYYLIIGPTAGESIRRMASLFYSEETRGLLAKLGLFPLLESENMEIRELLAGSSNP